MAATPDTTPEFPTAKFFTVFQGLLKDIDTYPLAPTNLVIHQDNFAKMGDPEEDNGFAHIGFDFPTGDTVLMFSVDFFNHGIFISADGQYGAELAYEELNPDPKKAAAKLINLLKAFANGQIKALYTYYDDNEKIQAIEIIYKRRGDMKVLATYPFFDSARKSKGRELNYILHHNSFELGEVSVNPELILTAFPPQEFTSFNRKLTNNTLDALPRDVWEKSVEAHYDEKADEIIAKVDKWSRANERISFRDMYLEFAEKRHQNLTLVLMLANGILAFGIGSIVPAIFAAVGVVPWLIAFALRNSGWRYILGPWLAYVAAVIAGVNLFVNQYDKPFYFILLVIVVVEVIECIVLDIVFWYRGRRTA